MLLFGSLAEVHENWAKVESLALPAAERQLPGLDLAQARSASSGDLHERLDDQEQIPERNALSLPQSSSQSQAEVDSQAASGQSNKEGSSSGFSSLNRPQGCVPAVPDSATEQGGLNFPEGVVPSVPGGTSESSSAQQAEHAHSYSEEPARRIRRDRPVGQQAEYEQQVSQEPPGSAAEAERSRTQQQADGAPPDCGRGAENCAEEGPELQGCQACLRKHQQLELKSLEAKGLEDVSIGRRKAGDELQVGSASTHSWHTLIQHGDKRLLSTALTITWNVLRIGRMSRIGILRQVPVLVPFCDE